ncbi:hypothetical protein NHX12_011301 [Muraenolepis orangiensis]|uniref:Uncharacterized protein n=1 Tax=Muraenolepis orangiensis TaxID=630683 RepID=A0A9Q0DEY4_9TELE|nr:hypothetical protein NHX12_011301 [Muraenolepis orangiensis]
MSCPPLFLMSQVTWTCPSRDSTSSGPRQVTWTCPSRDTTSPSPRQVTWTCPSRDTTSPSPRQSVESVDLWARPQAADTLQQITDHYLLRREWPAGRGSTP